MVRSIMAPPLAARSVSLRPARPKSASSPGRARLLLFVSDAILALRLSNAVAVVLLFVAGYRLGRSSGRTPWVMGISMVVIDALMVRPLHSAGRMRPREQSKAQ